MRPDKRYGAFLILSIAILTVFLFSSSRYSIRSNATPGGTTSVFNKRPAGPAAVEGAFPVFPVDINTAGVDELKLLPGVGEMTAQRIIEKRKELGRFRTVDELMEVKWIGRGKLNRIRNLVTVNNTGKNETGPGEEARAN